VAAATRNQAKSALLFLYKDVLGVELPWFDEIVSAKGRQRLPMVLTPSEVEALLHEPSGVLGVEPQPACIGPAVRPTASHSMG